MKNPKSDAYKFGRYDRITINGAHYRYVSKNFDQHKLQLMEGNRVADHYTTFSDLELSDFMRRGAFRLDEQYFSKAKAEMRQRDDMSSLLDLDEAQTRDLLWKEEWVERFLKARDDPWGFAPKMTHNDIATFIANERDKMDRWYLDRFGERRRRGRPVLVTSENLAQVTQRKDFDYPSPTTLRNWVRRYRRSNEHPEGLMMHYHRCGRRSQLAPEIEDIVSKSVMHYADLRRPAKQDIYDRVEAELEHLNAQRSNANLPALSVHRSTIYRRINALNPVFVEIGRYGKERALRRNLPVGQGLDVTEPMQRIEIDDWDVDLQVLACRTEEWAGLSPKMKAAIARVRPTVTVAIDCATRCIVGFNISDGPPTTAGAKAALRSIMIDKTGLAKFGGCQSDWAMKGRPMEVVTDGGPVFQREFEDAVRMSCNERVRPDQDPRMRGTIEAFFRYLRRACRLFTGRTFSNVVEKDDYDAEQMASLTYEAFYQACVRFIVDIYHHRRHRGIGQTPYIAWQNMTAAGMSPVPSDAQIKLAFGFRHDGVRLDKHGVLFAGLSYNNTELARLKLMLGEGKKVDLVIDPEELGSVLVIVPRRLRKQMAAAAPDKMFGAVLLVECTDKRAAGTKLAHMILAKKRMREKLARQEEQGRKIRIDANRALFDVARKAEQNAPVPTHLFTQKSFEKVVKEYMKGAERALGQRPSNPEPSGDDTAMFGQEIARSKRRDPQGAINGSAKAAPAKSQRNTKRNEKTEEPPAPQVAPPPSNSINLYKRGK